MQVGQLTSQLDAAQRTLAALESKAESLQSELAASHAARTADIQEHVALLQV
jgi:hypothetical protein